MTSRPSRRTALRAALSLPVALAAGGTRALAATTGPATVEKSIPASAPASGPDRLRIVGPWEIGGLEPARTGYLFARLQVAETLTGALDDGTPAPGLATRWEVSADGLAWRFRLRAGARFHDGTPVTAPAVVRSLWRARTPPAQLSLAPIEAIEAAGDDTVSIRLSRPWVGLPAVLAHSSAMVLAPSSFGDDGSVRAVIGSGPYRVSRLAPPQQLEIVAAPGHASAPLPIAGAHYLAVTRAETRVLMAESGQADLAWRLDPAGLQRLRANARARIVSVMLPRTIIVKVNAGHPWLSDARVRRALSLAIDRDGIARALLRDPELAATQLFPPSLGGWHDAALAPLRHAPDEAAALLAAAGFSREAGALRAPGGAPLRLRLRLRTFPDRPELPIIAVALQEQWRRLGLEVRVANGNSGDIPLGHRDGSLELALAARNYGNAPDPLITLLQDFGPDGGDWGAMNWRHEGLLAAMRALAGGAEPARADALRRSMAATLQSELPVLPIAWYREHVAVAGRVAGVRLDPLERSLRLDAMRWAT